MNSDNNNYEVFQGEDHGKYRVYCDICDKLCIERCYTNHLKSGTPTNNIYKRQPLNNTKYYLFSLK